MLKWISNFVRFVAIELHDGFTQTGPGIDQIKWDGVTTRASQTAELRNTTDVIFRIYMLIGYCII